MVDERLRPAMKACGYITSDSRDAGSPVALAAVSTRQSLPRWPLLDPDGIAGKIHKPYCVL